MDGCTAVAATVDVIPRGQAYPEGAHDPVPEVFPEVGGTVRVTGFLPYTGFSTAVPDLAAAVAAVRAVDAGALHALDHAWTPFYCRHCDRSYCGEHWDLHPVFDWGFDYYRGSCPAGHPHMIDH